MRELEQARKSRLLVYLTGDRRGLETRIAYDAFPFTLTHLKRMGKQKRIDLFLYSPGGLSMAGFGLVNLIREFCESFGVIVPFKAHSAATLMALGADEIIMTKLGQLSPIDPSVVSLFGPQLQVPGQPGAAQALPVNVEDVMGYLDLAKETLGTQDPEGLIQAFERLSQTVHPLALGAVSRIREQTLYLAKTLLEYHISGEARIQKIIKAISQGRFSHEYLIGRKEAKDVLKLDIVEDEGIEDKAMQLYSEYDELLELNTPYNAEAVLAGKETTTASFNRAIIESHGLTHVFRTTKAIERVMLTPPQVPAVTMGVFEKIIEERWFEDTNI